MIVNIYSAKVPRRYRYYLSSNNPKNVQATKESNPTIKVKIAKINFSKNSIAIALVMKVKETNK